MKHSSMLLIRLFCLFIFIVANISTFSLSAQEECQSPVFFEGEPESGFCSGPLPNCTTVLGTSITQSSQLPAAVLSGTICIQGNFTISTGFPLTFINATVLIAPEVEIIVQEQSTFTLNNSSLHGCDGLWKGIKLLHNASVFTLNQTLIEDARKAINASFVSASISVENTTFNRNVNGIWLEDVENAINPPRIVNIYNSNFICNGPITGTLKDITEHGIYSIHCPVSFVQGTEPVDHHVVFRNLKYGIRVLGNRSISLKGQNFAFHQIRYSCINLRRGEIDFENSEFINYGDYGIVVERLRDLKLSGCDFRLIETDPEFFPAPSPVFRSPLSYSTDWQMATIPQININNDCSFIYDCPSVDEVYLGIIAGNNSNKFDLKVINNVFFTHGLNARGITLTGGYSPDASVEIFSNTFTTRGTLGLMPNTVTQSFGIHAQNQTNNTHIVGNSFYGGNEIDEEGSGIYSISINLYQSQGFNNKIISNTFFGNTTFGVYTLNCTNWNICSNFSILASIPYYFQGDNLGINFSHNQMVLGNVLIDGKIFLQEQKDNTWDGGLFRGSAYCLTSNCENFSPFLVRQPINSNFFPAQQFCGFPPLPCAPNKRFFFNLMGTPTPCADESPEPEDDLFLLSIAENTIDSLTEYTSKEFYYQSYLYDLLKHDSVLLNTHPSFQNFLMNEAATPIGQFFVVKRLLYDAYSLEFDMQKIETALVLNNGILATSTPELNQKKVNQIQLNSILNNAGHLTSLEIDEIRQIASQCFREGGMAVSHATSLLKECNQILTEIDHNCGSTPKVIHFEDEVSERSNGSFEKSSNSHINFTNDGQYLTFMLDEGQIGVIRIFDMAGAERYNQKISEGQQIVRVDISSLKSGIHIVSFTGDVNEVSKIFISR